MSDFNNKISFCAKFSYHGELNKTRFDNISKIFSQATSDYDNGCLHLIADSGNYKPDYYLARRLKYGIVRAEDCVKIPNEILGRWLVELQDDTIAVKLAKIFRILNIRRQAVYDLRKTHPDKPLELESIADKYLSRLKRFANNDEDIIRPETKSHLDKIGIWNGIYDAKADLYSLKSMREGHKIVVNV